MEIVENTPCRLVLRHRPVLQSYAWLAVALTFTIAIYLFYSDGRVEEAIFVSAGAIMVWGLLFLMPQSTAVIFDQDVGALVVHRRRLVGQSGFVVPLDDITTVRATLLPASRRSPWRYVLKLNTRQPVKRFGGQEFLVSVR